MNKSAEIINHLTDMFHFFNKELEAELTEPIITLIPNRGRSNYYGWYWKNRWRNKDEMYSEINIAPDYLDRSIDELANTMIHEMAHLKNSVLGIKDCNSAQYHNKKFKVMAEKFGLAVEKMRGRGYAITKLGGRSQELVNKYKKEILKDSNPFKMRRVITKSSGYQSNKKSVMIDKEILNQIEALYPGRISVSVEDILQSHLG